MVQAPRSYWAEGNECPYGHPALLMCFSRVFCPGEVQAGREIASGALQASSFRVFAGMMEWDSGRLLQDIQRGLW